MLDPHGVSKFELIQPRIHTRDANAIAKMARRIRFTLIVFDLLYLDGYDLRQSPLSARKAALEKIVKPFPLCCTSPSHLSDEAGDDLLEAARQSGLEGLIAKAPDQRLRIAPQPRLAQAEAHAGAGIRDRRIHAGRARLLSGRSRVGFHEDGKLIYCGQCRDGLQRTRSAGSLTKMQARLIDKMPFAARQAHSKGNGLGEVRSLSLRSNSRTGPTTVSCARPCILGLREDKAPAEVGRETVPEVLSAFGQEGSHARNRRAQPEVHQSRQAVFSGRRLHETRSSELLQRRRAAACSRT